MHTPTSSLSPAALPTKAAYPLSIAPLSPAAYFVVREAFNPLSLLQQPMALMTVFMLVMVLLVPRMMSGMSDEEKREMANMQQSFSVASLLKSAAPSAVTGNEQQRTRATR
jgi:ABC-type lipoprotein export system ATPase subunit